MSSLFPECVEKNRVPSLVSDHRASRFLPLFPHQLCPKREGFINYSHRLLVLPQQTIINETSSSQEQLIGPGLDRRHHYWNRYSIEPTVANVHRSRLSDLIGQP